MSEYLHRIESMARSLLETHQSQSEHRTAIVTDATSLISNLVPDVEATGTNNPLQEMLFERALRLFEDGHRDGNAFSATLKKPTLLAALLGAIEYTGDIRDIPLINDPNALAVALKLASENWSSRFEPKILRLVLSHHLTLQDDDYIAVVSIVRKMLDSFQGTDQITNRFKTALIDSEQLQQFVSGKEIIDPIVYLESTGFRSRDLYGQFTQAFVLAWISSSGSDAKVDLKIVERLTEYSGDAEYRTVLWAHAVQMYAKHPNQWDSVFPQAISRLPGVGSSAMWKIQQRYLLSYQIVLDSARSLLKRWLNREMSRAFFDHLRFHQDRKKFWEPYVENAQSVRIAASREVVSRMLSRSVNPEHLRDRYIRGLGDTPALIIEGATRLFIEFGEEGNATYAYQKDIGEQIVGRIRGRSIKELKNTSLTGTMRFEAYRQNRNVRLLHHDGWEKVYRRIFRLTGEFE